MDNKDIAIAALKQIPKGLWQEVVDNTLKAWNTNDYGTPMEYLFDVYEEFIDLSGEHDDWNCWTCRNHILIFFQTYRPWLMEQLLQK